MTATEKRETIIALAPVPVKYPGQRSGHCFNVEVDGIVWAAVNRESRGMHGYHYSFCQIGGEGIGRTHEPRYKSDSGWRQVVVRGASKREARMGGTRDQRPTEQRIIDEAKKLIAEGLMIHPDQRKAQAEEARRKIREAGERRGIEINEEFRRRAAECLPGGALPNDAENEATILKIVDAMKWAQTQ